VILNSCDLSIKTIQNLIRTDIDYGWKPEVMKERTLENDWQIEMVELRNDNKYLHTGIKLSPRVAEIRPEMPLPSLSKEELAPLVTHYQLSQAMLRGIPTANSSD